MSVSAYGHCRPRVEDYDSWQKHTTHLSSAQEERLQWSNAYRQRQMAPGVGFIIPPLYQRDLQEPLPRGERRCQSSDVTAARPAGSPREVWLWNSRRGCWKMPAGLAGVTKRRAQGLAPRALSAGDSGVSRVCAMPLGFPRRP